MKKVTLALIFLYLMINCQAQEIVNFVMVGDKGITDNPKEAKSFILIKQFPNSFQRLDYNVSKPLIKLRTYSDSNLTILDGLYCDYHSNGYIYNRGYYKNGLMDGFWYEYNKSGKRVLEKNYENGKFVSAKNYDSVKLDNNKKAELKEGEIEAEYEGGDGAWRNYLMNNLKGDVTIQANTGGEVVVNFIVNKSGELVDISLDKSVHYILDNEATRIIQECPKRWKPAFQNKRPVNAYRRQPIRFDLIVE